MRFCTKARAMRRPKQHTARGLSLLNTGFKVLSNLVLNRLQPHADEVIGEYHAGCTDHIHTPRAYLVARLEHQQDTHLIFVNFQRAYDTVIREVLWERMRDMGIPHKLIRMAQVTSRCTKNRVRTLSRLFQDFITRSGVRRGDALSRLPVSRHLFIFFFFFKFAISSLT